MTFINNLIKTAHKTILDHSSQDTDGLTETEISLENPYQGRPDYTYWRRGVSRVAWQEIDPLIEAPFIIEPETRIASAGSCFAQHIARCINKAGYNYYATEPNMENGPLFSAQYGNIYTARQLKQLFERAFGLFQPDEKASAWPRREDGLWVDAFRPTTCPARARAEEVGADREKHLACVRELFKSMDVFIFTLGLTEAWRCTLDQAVYPVAPGVIGARWPEHWFEFYNFSSLEVKTDLNKFIALLQEINPQVKIILTVSPVPLIATYENRHVLLANTYSKSALRVAADEVCRENRERVFYFPSYELFTGQQAGGRLYEADLREAAVNGVNQAMGLFMRHYMGQKRNAEIRPLNDNEPEPVLICDEDLID